MAKLETYNQLKSRQTKELNQLPLAFAFNGEQLQQALIKLGARSKKDVTSIGGAIVHRFDVDFIYTTYFRHDKELEEAKKDDKFLYDMVYYELGNHEYCITNDFEDTFRACDIEEDKLTNHQRTIIGKARTQHLSDYEAMW